jgi:hypothetical protein
MVSITEAVKALDLGDLAGLKALLEEDPALIHYECRTDDWYEQDYFAGATLLHHIAGNPIRCPLLGNIVEIARLLVGYHPTSKAVDETIVLILTSKQASEAGVALKLIDILVEAGGRLPDSARLLDLPLLNVAPDTARALVARGAKPELRHTAALGDLAALAYQFEEALVFACIRGQKEAAILLVKRGAKGDVLVAPGGLTPRTALHEAANRGHVEIVRLLVENGANTEVVEPRWDGTPAGWAEHGGHPEIVALLAASSL